MGLVKRLFRSKKNAHRYTVFTDSGVYTVTTSKKDLWFDLSALCKGFSDLIWYEKANYSGVLSKHRDLKPPEHSVKLTALLGKNYAGPLGKRRLKPAIANTLPPLQRRMKLTKIAAAAGVSILALGTFSTSDALPTGAQSVQGNVQFSTTGNTMNISTTANKSIASYNSFNVAANETVNFNLPSSSSVILNRVNNNVNPSSIMGNINSNGQVWLVNPAGITVGSGATVNVASFTASTLEISDQDFNNGNYQLTQQGLTAAGITNAGTINATNAIVLAGGAVNNTGSLAAPIIALGVGKQLTVNLSNSVETTITIDQQLVNAASGYSNAIQNSGNITAKQIILNAAIQNSLYSRTVNQTGVIQADSIDINNKGEVFIKGQAVVIANTVTTGSGLVSGGSITFEADTLDFVANGQSNLVNSNGGDIAITANTTNFNTISAPSSAYLSSNGGDITLTTNNLTLTGSTSYGASMFANAGTGDINLTTIDKNRDILLLGVGLNSSFTNSKLWLTEPFLNRLNADTLNIGDSQVNNILAGGLAIQFGDWDWGTNRYSNQGKEKLDWQVNNYNLNFNSKQFYSGFETPNSEIAQSYINLINKNITINASEFAYTANMVTTGQGNISVTADTLIFGGRFASDSGSINLTGTDLLTDLNYTQLGGLSLYNTVGEMGLPLTLYDYNSELSNNSNNNYGIGQSSTVGETPISYYNGANGWDSIITSNSGNINFQSDNLVFLSNPLHIENQTGQVNITSNNGDVVLEDDLFIKAPVINITAGDELILNHITMGDSDGQHRETNNNQSGGGKLMSQGNATDIVKFQFGHFKSFGITNALEIDFTGGTVEFAPTGTSYDLSNNVNNIINNNVALSFLYKQDVYWGDGNGGWVDSGDDYTPVKAETIRIGNANTTASFSWNDALDVSKLDSSIQNFEIQTQGDIVLNTDMYLTTPLNLSISGRDLTTNGEMELNGNIELSSTRSIGWNRYISAQGNITVNNTGDSTSFSSLIGEIININGQGDVSASSIGASDVLNIVSGANVQIDEIQADELNVNAANDINIGGYIESQTSINLNSSNGNITLGSLWSNGPVNAGTDISILANNGNVDIYGQLNADELNVNVFGDVTIWNYIESQGSINVSSINGNIELYGSHINAATDTVISANTGNIGIYGDISSGNKTILNSAQGDVRFEASITSGDETQIIAGNNVIAEDQILGGRWLVNIEDRSKFIVNSVGDEDFKRYNADLNNGYNIGSLPSGNGVLFRVAPVINVTANSVSREYGDANPTLGYNLSGFIDYDDASVLSGSALVDTLATQNSDVGNYTITSALGTLSNELGYTFNFVNGTLDITKATVNVTANNATREYGDTNPTFTANYSGFKLGQNASVIDQLATVSSSATQSSDVGNYAINASGALDNNYNFNYSNGNLEITKATVNVTANNATREYGDTNPTFTANYSGFKLGQNASVIDQLATISSSATQSSDVGSYAINASGALDNNYNFNYTNGNLEITKATVNVTANNATREYGDTNPTFTANYSGFKLGQNTSVIDQLATVSSSATQSSDAGDYSITASGALDNNYNFNYANGTLDITKATVNVTANNATREFGANNPTLGASYTGFKLGQDQSVIDQLANITTSATSSSAVGNYAIVASGALDNNYNFNYINGTLDIQALPPEPITVAPVPFITNPYQIQPASQGGSFEKKPSNNFEFLPASDIHQADSLNSNPDMSIEAFIEQPIYNYKMTPIIEDGEVNINPVFEISLELISSSNLANEQGISLNWLSNQPLKSSQKNSVKTLMLSVGKD